MSLCGLFYKEEEVGTINIGGNGRIIIDDKVYAINKNDAIYIGMRTKEIVFESVDSNKPARFTSIHVLRIILIQ